MKSFIDHSLLGISFMAFTIAIVVTLCGCATTQPPKKNVKTKCYEYHYSDHSTIQCRKVPH